jgi:hypothetical protein
MLKQASAEVGADVGIVFISGVSEKQQRVRTILSERISLK